MTRLAALLLVSLAAVAPFAPRLRQMPLFTDAERAQLVAYWNAPGRCVVGLPADASKQGPWQVRLTPDGSRWFWSYQRAIGAAKAPPTVDATAAAPGATPDAAEWEKWVETKLAWDRYQAQQSADAANAAVLHTQPSALNPQPAAPGPIPSSLLAAVGNPPPFANAVAPREYTITFDDGDHYAYQDNVVMRPRFAYYRWPQGTVAYGTPLRQMPEADLDALFAAAGFSPSEQRIAKAVSRLEGGFDAVNTYDTGYVSVGFIQFVTMEDGRHSLIEVLQREKTDRPADFARDFHRFGLDVTPDGTIAAVDPATGALLVGPDAVHKLIEDKRFAAVFQRAGLHSQSFRVAQIAVARSHYWPLNDTVTVTIDGQTVTGKVSDIIHSEAGIATLFDRKVNRGSIAPLPDVVAKVMAEHNVTTFAALAPFEREIVQGVKYRTDFLADSALSQPPAR